MDDDSDTERETLLPKNYKAREDEDFSDEYANLCLKYASSSEDEADNFDSDEEEDEDEDGEGVELLASEHNAISSSIDEDCAPVAYLSDKEDSLAIICDMSSENLFNETLESSKEIDNVSVCQLVDGIIVSSELPKQRITDTDLSKLSPQVNVAEIEKPESHFETQDNDAREAENRESACLQSEDNEFKADFSNADILFSTDAQFSNVSSQGNDDREAENRESTCIQSEDNEFKADFSKADISFSTDAHFGDVSSQDNDDREAENRESTCIQTVDNEFKADFSNADIIFSTDAQFGNVSSVWNTSNVKTSNLTDEENKLEPFEVSNIECNKDVGGSTKDIYQSIESINIEYNANDTKLLNLLGDRPLSSNNINLNESTNEMLESSNKPFSTKEEIVQQVADLTSGNTDEDFRENKSYTEISKNITNKTVLDASPKFTTDLLESTSLENYRDTIDDVTSFTSQLKSGEFCETEEKDDILTNISKSIESNAESDQQVLTKSDDGSEFKKHSINSEDPIFCSTESIESYQKHNKISTEDNSCKEINEEGEDKLKDLSSISKGFYENDDRTDCRETDHPCPTKLKQHSGSSKDLYLSSTESIESDQQGDFKAKRESITDMYEPKSGETSERNKNENKTESTEIEPLLFAKIDGNLNKHSGSCKDLYLTSTESMESDQQSELKARRKSTSNTGISNFETSVKNIEKVLKNKSKFTRISTESTETDQKFVSNSDEKSKTHSGSSKDLYFTSIESIESDPQQISNSELLTQLECVNPSFELSGRSYVSPEAEDRATYDEKHNPPSKITHDLLCAEGEHIKTLETPESHQQKEDATNDSLKTHKPRQRCHSETRECRKGSLELYHSAMDIHEYGVTRPQESKTPDLKSGYFEKTDSVQSKDGEFKDLCSGGQHHLQYDQTISESLRNQLNRFDLLIETMDQRNTRNMATNAVERGYWSTIFGQASEIEAYDELSAERKAHRALELLEDYHSRLSEPQDRALRIAIERVIRIFKSRLFQALLARDFMLAYKHQSQCIQSVVKMLQQLKEENWCLPVMYTACLDLRILAQRCEELGNSSKPGEILEKAADCLMSCFRVCAADNRSSDNETKRLGMLHLVNQLFKVYFRINKLHLCKPLIRAIDSSAFKDMFPLPERITYKYFVGRKAMFDSDYKSADEFLSFAFKHCPKNFPRNKRLILIYLVPVKMLLGFLPKKHILERYDVLQFHELAEALKEGNVRKFDDVIQRHEIFFIKCGIYLLVEKLKFIVYRNLFKKVYIIKQTHQLDLNAFTSALKFVGETDMTIDETHCIVANLIFEGKIKGYISHSHNKLVVSKQNPFPPLNTVS